MPTITKPRELKGQHKSLSQLGVKRLTTYQQFSCGHITDIGHLLTKQCYSCWLKTQGPFPQAEVQESLFESEFETTDN